MNLMPGITWDMEIKICGKHLIDGLDVSTNCSDIPLHFSWSPTGKASRNKRAVGVIDGEDFSKPFRSSYYLKERI